MSTASMPVKEPVPMTTPAKANGISPASATVPTAKLKFQTLMAVPLAAAVGIALHLAVKKNDPEPDTTSWIIFLASILGLALLLAIVQPFSDALRRWMAHMCPI